MRKITDEDIRRYKPMVEKFLRDQVRKNWVEFSLKKGQDEIALGNTGWTVADLRQYLMTEVYVALTKYNPDYRTKEGKSVKESSFTYNHLSFRVGQLCKRLTKKRAVYGVWASQLEDTLGENGSEE